MSRQIFGAVSLLAAASMLYSTAETGTGTAQATESQSALSPSPTTSLGTEQEALSLVEQVAAKDAPQALALLAAEIEALKAKVEVPLKAAEGKFSAAHPKAASAIVAAGALLKKMFPQTATDLATLQTDLDG